MSGDALAPYGAIEVCLGGVWGGICSDRWDNSEARVVCKELGHSPYGMQESSVLNVFFKGLYLSQPMQVHKPVLSSSYQRPCPLI